jgi:hypothetical protein
MMLPLVILFAQFTIAICVVGAIIFSVLYFSDWGEKKEHGDRAPHSDHKHH